MKHFRINEQVISKCNTNLKLSNCPGPDEIIQEFKKGQLIAQAKLSA